MAGKGNTFYCKGCRTRCIFYIGHNNIGCPCEDCLVKTMCGVSCDLWFEWREGKEKGWKKI